MSKRLYYIICTLLTVGFVVSVMVYYFIPLVRTGEYITAKPVASEKILTGNNEISEGKLSILNGDKININTADAQDLEALPGIGPSLASAIVEYREENGPFTATGEIMNVSGIGKGRYEAICEYITLE